LAGGRFSVGFALLGMRNVFLLSISACGGRDCNGPQPLESNGANGRDKREPRGLPDILTAWPIRKFPSSCPA
jgi:hypothetical protein